MKPRLNGPWKPYRMYRDGQPTEITGLMSEGEASFVNDLNRQDGNGREWVLEPKDDTPEPPTRT